MQKTVRSSKSPLTLLVLLGIMIISTLVVISDYFVRPGMEQDLTQKVTQGLHKQGLLDATVKVRGRDVILSGSVPNSVTSKQAEEMIQQIQGIHQIDNNLVNKNQSIE